MSDFWYRDPFDLPPYVDGFGDEWSFTGERLSGVEPPGLDWPEDWPEDLRYLLFQAEICLKFAEKFRANLWPPEAMSPE